SSGCQRSVAGFGGLLHGLDRFFRGHQRCGLDGFAGAAARECNRYPGSADVIGHFCDDDDVVLAERVPGALDLAAQLFYGWPDGFDSILRLRKQCPPGFWCVCDLMQVMWHGTSLALWCDCESFQRPVLEVKYDGVH